MKKAIAKRNKAVRKKTRKPKTGHTTKIELNKFHGKTNKKRDSKRKALKPDRRVSRTGEKYTETRANRSDKGKYL